jgi:peroxiredoxin
VLAVALDGREAARPWIEAAAPGYPCLIDRDHRVAELYNLVNVPQAYGSTSAAASFDPLERPGRLTRFGRWIR